MHVKRKKHVDTKMKGRKHCENKGTQARRERNLRLQGYNYDSLRL